MSTGNVLARVEELNSYCRDRNHPSIRIMLMDTLTHLAKAIDLGTAKVTALEAENDTLKNEKAELEKSWPPPSTRKRSIP